MLTRAILGFHLSTSVTAAFPLSDFFPLTFLVTFLCFCTHIFIIGFCILFTQGDLYSVRFSHNSALFNFIRKSFSKKSDIGVSECVRLTSISSLQESFSFSVLRARKSHNVCKCLSLSECISSFVCVFLFLLLRNNL